MNDLLLIEHIPVSFDAVVDGAGGDTIPLADTIKPETGYSGDTEESMSESSTLDLFIDLMWVLL